MVLEEIALYSNYGLSKRQVAEAFLHQHKMTQDLVSSETRPKLSNHQVSTAAVRFVSSSMTSKYHLDANCQGTHSFVVPGFTIMTLATKAAAWQQSDAKLKRLGAQAQIKQDPTTFYKQGGALGTFPRNIAAAVKALHPDLNMQGAPLGLVGRPGPESPRPKAEIMRDAATNDAKPPALKWLTDKEVLNERALENFLETGAVPDADGASSSSLSEEPDSTYEVIEGVEPIVGAPDAEKQELKPLEMSISNIEHKSEAASAARESDGSSSPKEISNIRIEQYD